MITASTPLTDLQLLRAYALEKSDDAFRTLVDRHGPWLLAAAFRQLRDRQLAEDAAQVVFILLAQRSHKMLSNPKLSGWLFNTLQFSVKNLLRARRRRHLHESRAAIEQDAGMKPHPADTDLSLRVDAAVARLSAAERHLVLLRFYQDHTFPEIAAMLGITEMTTRKRFSRAADILRKRLGNNALPAAHLSAALAIAAIPSLPNTLANIALAAKNGALIPATLAVATKGTVSLMAISKLKTTILLAAVALLLGSVATVLVIETQNHSPPTSPITPIAEAPTAGPIPFSPDLKSVQTFYFHDNGGGDLSNDVYLTRDKGMLQRQTASGWTVIHYFSGETEWAYREDSTLVLRKKHAVKLQNKMASLAQTLAAAESVLSLTNVQATREPSEDAAVQGVACQAFRTSAPLLNAPAESILLINPNNGRIIGLKFGKIDTEISYDPPLPEDLFKIPAGPNIQIVDAAGYFEKKYPLETAIFTADALGQTFAIHHVEQDTAGCYHVICSTRITSTNKPALKDLTDDQIIIGFSPSASIAGNHFHSHILDLATFEQSGIQVSYLLILPQPGLTPDNHCQFGVTLNASPVIKARLAESGVSMENPAIPIDLQVKPAANIPTTRTFASQAYDAVSPLVGLVHGSHMPAPKQMGQGMASREDFLKAVETQLNRYAPQADTTP